MKTPNVSRIAAAFASSLLALALAAPAHATCTTNTPLSVWGQGGSNGLLASSGTPGYDAGSIVGQITNDLSDLDGTANLRGTAACDAGDVLSVAAALSAPAWLEDGEKFSLSGGFGFADDAFALGATGIMRLDKNLSAFAGGAVSTDNSDVWAAKAGLRVGW